MLKQELKHRTPADSGLVLCVRHHYDAKTNRITGFTHPNRKNGSGKDPFVAPYLFMTHETVDVSYMFSQSDFDNIIRKFSHSAIDSCVLQSKPLKDYEEKLVSARKDFRALSTLQRNQSPLSAIWFCAFCSCKLFLKPRVICMVCNNSSLCTACFKQRRQGVIWCQNSEAGKETVLVHRSDHAYQVSRPELDFKFPELGVDVLEFVVGEGSFESCKIEYELISLIRGPVPRKLGRAPAPRYLYGVKLTYKLSTMVKQRVVTVASTLFGRSPDEGKGLVGFEAAEQLFGIKTKYSHDPFGKYSMSRGATLISPPPPPAVTLLESLKLLDALERHGLAWKPSASNVNSTHLTPIGLRDYFNEVLLPAFLAQTEFGKLASQLARDKQFLVKVRKQYEVCDFFPRADVDQVKAMISESILWARNVKRFFLRRCLLSKRNHRGISFAVIEKQTIFQPRPHSFGKFLTTTSKTLETAHQELLQFIAKYRENPVDPSLFLKELQSWLSKVQTEKEDVPSTDTVVARTEQNGWSSSPSVCLICHQDKESEKLVQCDGCDGFFHLKCVPPQSFEGTESQRFCEHCVEDRAYLYDHTSWGGAGKTLSRIADRTIFDSVEHMVAFMEYSFDKNLESAPETEVPFPQKDSEEGDDKKTEPVFSEMAAQQQVKLPLVSQEWLDNDKVLETASNFAVTCSFTNEPQPQSRKRKEITSRESSGETSDGKKELAMKMCELMKTLGVDREIITALNWSTRHFADNIIVNLQYANRGLAQALLEVTEQRNALLHELSLVKPTKKQPENGSTDQ